MTTPSLGGTARDTVNDTEADPSPEGTTLSMLALALVGRPMHAEGVPDVGGGEGRAPGTIVP